MLDAKAAQNLSVILGGALKHISYPDLRKCILRCDTTVLTENLLQSLIQYLPSPDQLNKLQEHASDYENLAEAEQFAISLADIKRLVLKHIFVPIGLAHPNLNIQVGAEAQIAPIHAPLSGTGSRLQAGHRRSHRRLRGGSSK